MGQRVVHFEVIAEQPERALRFYAEVFGWKAQKWEGPEDYWLLTTGEEGELGINGGLARTRDTSMPACTVNTIAVPSVDEFAEKVTQNGGKVVMPRMEVPGVGHLAYCQATEGITFGIIEFASPNAT